eukprot:snap_masked-scaffold_61-processed-gene-0.51-mRNA-1 protein AED:0.54 eAED:0.60 QI:0/-1/0/1/-1/1/1/0/352
MPETREESPPTSPRMIARQQSTTLANVAEWFIESINKYPNVLTSVISTLRRVLQVSTSETMLGLQADLHKSIQIIKKSFISLQREGKFRFTHLLGVDATCEQFLRYLTLHSTKIENLSDELLDFADLKDILLEKTLDFEEQSEISQDEIIKKSYDFFFNSNQEKKILIHGGNSIILNLLRKYFNNNKRNINLFITDDVGLTKQEEEELRNRGGKVITNRAVAFFMDSIDLVLVSSFGVCENGGIINKIGTYNIAIIAKTFNVPFYAIAESQTFTRLFPLNQQELANECNLMLEKLEIEAEGEEIEKMIPLQRFKSKGLVADFTPPKYIQLLFTDLGILTPSAVSDELIKLYL